MIKGITKTVPIEWGEREKVEPLCKYLLPCGLCDLTKYKCNVNFIKEGVVYDRNEK